jgi:hypothetical protein
LRRDGAGPAAGRSPNLPPEAASRDATQISGTSASGKRLTLNVPPFDSSLEGKVQRPPGAGRKGFDKK